LLFTTPGGIIPIIKKGGVIMDVSSIAGTSSIMKSSETQQVLSTSMIKQNAQSQDQVAAMIAQNAKQAPQPAQSSGQGFSTQA